MGKRTYLIAVGAVAHVVAFGYVNTGAAGGAFDVGHV